MGDWFTLFEVALNYKDCTLNFGFNQPNVFAK